MIIFDTLFIYVALVTVLIANTTSEDKKGGDEFWQKSEILLYTALIAYLYYEAPKEEQNFAVLAEMISAMEVKEDDGAPLTIA